MASSSCINILIIDKAASQFLKIKQLIQQIPNGNFKIDWCNDLSNGLRKICKFSHDLYIFNFLEGDSELMDTIPTSKTCNPDVPIIILTNNENQEIVFKSINFNYRY